MWYGDDMKKKRFNEFRRTIQNQLGYNADLLADDSIVICDAGHIVNRFHSLQAAIDRYARHMPENFVNPE